MLVLAAHASCSMLARVTAITDGECTLPALLHHRQMHAYSLHATDVRQEWSIDTRDSE